MSTTVSGFSLVFLCEILIPSFEFCISTSNGRFIYRTVSRCSINVSGSCCCIILTFPLIQKLNSKISRIHPTIETVNLPPNHNMFIWNTSDEKDKVLALKCLKGIKVLALKVYKEPNLKTFTSHYRIFHMIQPNIWRKQLSLLSFLLYFRQSENWLIYS